jgi:hypothetical protein
MTTPNRIEANRLNAQNSTGPRSVEGKETVRFNAVQHGAYAESLVLPNEDPAALAELRRQYFDQFQPDTPAEDTLVTTIACSMSEEWLLISQQAAGSGQIHPCRKLVQLIT